MRVGFEGAVAGWHRSGREALLPWALVIGAGAGLGAVGFRYLVLGATRLFTGTDDYSAAGPHGHPGHPWLPWLGAGFVVLAPAVGGLLYGPLVDRWAREARGHGVPEVMYAVSQRGGRIAGRVAVVKAFASALCIGSGGSVGREGPIVQIGSALGSTLGRVAKMPEARVRTLVACGAAGGIAATFNAPIAGVFFALELLLRDFAAEAFGSVVISAVVAAVVGRSLLGDTPFLDLPAFSVHSPLEYLVFAVLGVVSGGAGVLFTRVLYGIEDLADRIWRGPEWARPAVGGLLLGALLLVLPQMYGVGYPVLAGGVAGQYAVGFLLLLLVAKMVATSLTIAIGGSGGVFAPSLFVGAMLGAIVGQLGHVLAPGVVVDPGAYAVVGMAAVFAGAARAPITAVIILFELTGEYSVILPLMLAVVLATGVSRGLSRDTVYTMKLSRRGVDLDAHPGDERLRSGRVADVAEPAPPALAPGTSLADAARTLLGSGRPAAPVVEDGRLVGTVSARAVAEAMAEDVEERLLTLEAVTEVSETVAPGDDLLTALERLETTGSAGLPVVGADGAVSGWLTHAGVLRRLAGAAASDRGAPGARGARAR